MDTPFPQEIIPPAVPEPLYRDRKTGLVIFGIIQIVFGLFAALLVPLSLIGMVFATKMNGAGVPGRYYILSEFFYLLAAVVLIALGIGSFLAKRWARDLCLILSWVWLIGGSLVTIFSVVALPSTFLTAFKTAAAQNPQAGTMPAGCSAVVVTVMIAFSAVIGVVLPLFMMLFYGKKDVQDTCRHRDPVARWTEKIPLPLLAACLLFFYASLYYLLASFALPLMPFFGRYLTGFPGGIACIVMAAVDFVIAVLFFQRKIAGWWIAVADAIVRGLAIATTAGRANVFEAYSRMGWPSAQLQMMQSNPLYRSNWIIWGGLVGVVVTLGYLLWLRRFFTASNTP